MLALRTLLRVADANGQMPHPQLDRLATQRLGCPISLRASAFRVRCGNAGRVDEVQSLARGTSGGRTIIHESDEQLHRVAIGDGKRLVHIRIRRLSALRLSLFWEGCGRAKREGNG